MKQSTIHNKQTKDNDPHTNNTEFSLKTGEERSVDFKSECLQNNIVVHFLLHFSF